MLSEFAINRHFFPCLVKYQLFILFQYLFDLECQHFMEKIQIFVWYGVYLQIKLFAQLLIDVRLAYCATVFRDGSKFTWAYIRILRHEKWKRDLRTFYQILIFIENNWGLGGDFRFVINFLWSKMFVREG